MPTPCSIVTTAKSDIVRPSPNQSSASVTRLASLSMTTGTPSRAAAASRRGIREPSTNGDQWTRPVAPSTKPGTPMPTEATCQRETPDRSTTRSTERLDLIEHGRQRKPPLAMRQRRLRHRPPGEIVNDGAMRRTRELQPDDIAGLGPDRERHRRPASRWADRAAARRSPPAGRLRSNSAAALPTEAGLTPRRLAISTRGSRPAARTCSKTCRRWDTSEPRGAARSGPTPGGPSPRRAGTPALTGKLPGYFLQTTSLLPLGKNLANPGRGRKHFF